MKLSIVISNYNYETFVGQAIESALGQTHDDVEVIVADDGSKDGSRAVIESFGDRVTAVFKENGGQNSALNAGFELASGEVVIFLDADDRIDLETGAKVVNAFAAHADVARVQWPLRIVDAQGVANGVLSPNPASMPNGNIRAEVLKYRTHVWPPQSGNAYAMTALKQLMPIPAYFRIGCDKYLADTTPLLGSIVSFPTAGGDYRVHGKNNFTGNASDIGIIRDQVLWTMESDNEIRRVCRQIGIDYPTDSLQPLDVAFICQRLASLRLAPEQHPIKTDKRLALVVRGIHAAIAHPQHSIKHKAKRVAWILGVGLGTKKTAHKFVDRFYFRHKA